jgi:hypothetical protein
MAGCTDNATVCGELDALSVATKVAEGTPVVVGLYAICRLQALEGSKIAAQVLETISNSLALGPEIVKGLISKYALPVLVRKTV